MDSIDYDAQAQGFLNANGFTVKASFKGNRCPPWEDGRCIHGDRYLVTIKRQG